jgi:hypothetical protein
MSFWGYTSAANGNQRKVVPGFCNKISDLNIEFAAEFIQIVLKRLQLAELVDLGNCASLARSISNLKPKSSRRQPVAHNRLRSHGVQHVAPLAVP